MLCFSEKALQPVQIITLYSEYCFFPICLLIVNVAFVLLCFGPKLEDYCM